MAPRKAATEEVEDNGGGYRLSITIDPSIRKKLRLAAAWHDMSIGEWSAKVLERAADKATEGMPTPKQIEV